MPLGLYISVPFCRTKCTYCNFASDVFSRSVFKRYVDRVCGDLSKAAPLAQALGAVLEPDADTIYLGGGTPTVLDVAQLQRLFVTVRQNFTVQSDAEVTVECAPGTLSDALLQALAGCGVNRVSLGVQSFSDEESRAIGRLHNAATVNDDISRLRAAGIDDINLDLIAGLPHQTEESWKLSLDRAIAAGAPHVSVYMLEVDDDSRLGRELIAGGTRYHAHFVPDDDAIADFYVLACDRLEAAGLRQYEISNFAREGRQSRHNLKYWTRQPYLGFGVDAHSMLTAAPSTTERHALRLSTPDTLEAYVAGNPPNVSIVTSRHALEEEFFLGLRLNRGVDLERIARLGMLTQSRRLDSSGDSSETPTGDPSLVRLLKRFRKELDQLQAVGLVEQEDGRARLSQRGRLLSNDVFERFISGADDIDHELRRSARKTGAERVNQ